MELSDASKVKPFKENPKVIAFSLLPTAFLTAPNNIGCMLLGSYKIIPIVFITDSYMGYSSMWASLGEREDSLPPLISWPFFT